MHWIPTWTADSKRIVVWGQSGNLYRSYSVQNLRDSVPLDDVMPKAKALDRVTEWRGGEVDSVAALQGSEIVLLTVEGRLARVDAADSGIRTQPFLVHPAPNLAGTGLNGDLFAHVQLIARPGHPGQVAAVTMTGNQRGEILLWDVRTPRRIATLPGPAISVPSSTDSYTSALAFDTDGSHLAVQNTDGQVHVWDVDRRIPVAQSLLRLANLEATAADALVLIELALRLCGAGAHRLVVLARRNPLLATAAVTGLLWWCYRNGYLTRDNWRQRLTRLGKATALLLELTAAAVTEHQTLSDSLLVVEPRPIPPARSWPPRTSRAAAGY